MLAEVDQTSGIDRRVIRVGRQERRLNDTQLADRTDPVGSVDQPCAVLRYGVHDRPPAHTELLDQAGYRSGVGADLRDASTPAQRVNT